MTPHTLHTAILAAERAEDRARIAEVERERDRYGNALYDIVGIGTRKSISLPSGDTYDTLSEEAVIAQLALGAHP